METMNEFYNELTQKLDFKTGVIQDIDTQDRDKGFVLDVRFKRNVHLVLQAYERYNRNWYYVTRNEEPVSCIYHVKNFDDKIFHRIQHLIGEIENGDFDHKKTERERIAEIVMQRRLTSYMNDTKWRKFTQLLEEISAELEEKMSVELPYAWKTLFDEGADEKYEVYAWCEYLSDSRFWRELEWVKIMPRFCKEIHRGALVEPEKIWYDVTEKFEERMRQYAIPYELKDGVYTIYGYR